MHEKFCIAKEIKVLDLLLLMLSVVYNLQSQLGVRSKNKQIAQSQ